jgi:hypothetical protein
MIKNNTSHLERTQYERKKKNTKNITRKRTELSSLQKICLKNPNKNTDEGPFGHRDTTACLFSRIKAQVCTLQGHWLE